MQGRLKISNTQIYEDMYVLLQSFGGGGLSHSKCLLSTGYLRCYDYSITHKALFTILYIVSFTSPSMFLYFVP